MQEEETHNLPEMSKDGLRHSTPRPPEVVEIPRCNNVGIMWNEKMPAGPPLEGPKGEKLPEPPEGEDATLLWKHLILGQIIGLHIELGRNVCWNKSNTMPVSQTLYLEGQAGKKRRHCTTLITQISLSSAVIQMQGNPLTR